MGRPRIDPDNDSRFAKKIFALLDSFCGDTLNRVLYHYPKISYPSDK